VIKEAVTGGGVGGVTISPFHPPKVGKDTPIQNDKLEVGTPFIDEIDIIY
jgi:hypothetical protein